MNKLKNLCLVAICFTLIGCSVNMSKLVTKDRTEIEAIYLGEPGNYSVAVKDSSGVISIRHLNFVMDCGIHSEMTARSESAVYQFIPDVLENQPMYVQVERTVLTAPLGPDYKSVYQIHIHSIKDLGTSGWNHGKFGSGRTQTVAN